MTTIRFHVHRWLVEITEVEALSDPWEAPTRNWLRDAPTRVTVVDVLDGPLSYRPGYGRPT